MFNVFLASAQKATINRAILVFLSRQANGRKSDIDNKLTKGDGDERPAKVGGGGWGLIWGCFVSSSLLVTSKKDHQPHRNPPHYLGGFHHSLYRFIFRYSTMSRCSKATRQLLRTTSFWVLGFLLLVFLGALVFSEVERPSAISRLKSKDEKLASLQNEMKTEYNMTHEEFARFVNLSSEALSLDGPAWNYLDGLRYTFETLTTIGKHN